MRKSIDVNEKRFAMSPQLVKIFVNTLRDLKQGTLSKNRTVCARCKGKKFIPCEHCSDCGCVVCAGTKTVRCPDCALSRLT
jgi:hypothetical protein